MIQDNNFESPADKACTPAGPFHPPGPARKPAPVRQGGSSPSIPGAPFRAPHSAIALTRGLPPTNTLSMNSGRFHTAHTSAFTVQTPPGTLSRFSRVPTREFTPFHASKLAQVPEIPKSCAKFRKRISKPARFAPLVPSRKGRSNARPRPIEQFREIPPNPTSPPLNNCPSTPFPGGTLCFPGWGLPVPHGETLSCCTFTLLNRLRNITLHSINRGNTVPLCSTCCPFANEPQALLF